MISFTSLNLSELEVFRIEVLFSSSINYDSDNSHYAIAISVGEFDPLTSVSVYLRMKLEQGYIRLHMDVLAISIFLKIAPDSSLFQRLKI